MYMQTLRYPVFVSYIEYLKIEGPFYTMVLSVRTSLSVISSNRIVLPTD